MLRISRVEPLASLTSFNVELVLTTGATLSQHALAKAALTFLKSRKLAKLGEET